MKFIFKVILLCCLSVPAKAQYILKAIIQGRESSTSLHGATVTWIQQSRSVQADSSGRVVFQNIKPGNQTFIISYIGFREKTISYTFPLKNDEPIVIQLVEKDDNEEEAVVVTATRSSRTIANTPTRTEVISGEELGEKANMKPGDIRMLLSESTGIQTQQTSATSFNASIRIQGLDGRYTQLLRDGYPLYSGFSGGLSILQIAPLDLKQAEVIKGSSSTLYGGGAIAGLVNLVSKTPGNKRELSFLANGTSAHGLDISGFYSERFKKSGLTVFASSNRNGPFDPAGIGLTAIPKFNRYTINPRVFLYGNKTTADFGVSFITEKRIGGTIDYIKNDGPGFFEKNNTNRITTQIGVAHQLDLHSTLQFKNSYTNFDRNIIIPGYEFKATQQSSFSELTWNEKGVRSDWVIGANILTDKLKEFKRSDDTLRDYQYNTYGIFIQHSWTAGKNLIIETGLRGDYVKKYGFELLPRASMLIKLNASLSTRIGGGFGYKTPSIFTEGSEKIYFQKVPPVNSGLPRNERSAGGNWDINYRTLIGKVGFTINHLFFYTRLNRPLVLSPVNGFLQFRNSSGHIDTRGVETNLRFIYHNFKLFVGYTYTDANTHYTADKEWLPLTARHRLNNVLFYENKTRLKIGLEGYFFSRQQLSDGAFGRSYWTTGLMIEKGWPLFSVYINFENFTDTRQTRFDTIYTGSIDQPAFRDIYAPVDGFVINGGIKIKL